VGGRDNAGGVSLVSEPGSFARLQRAGSFEGTQYTYLPDATPGGHVRRFQGLGVACFFVLEESCDLACLSLLFSVSHASYLPGLAYSRRASVMNHES